MAGLDSFTKLLLHCQDDIQNDSFTKLLLHLDNNIIDSEGTAKTVTNNGTVTLETSVFGSSAKFSGSNYLTVPDSADWNFGTGDFTVDFWMNISTLPTGGNSAAVYSQSTDTNNYIIIFYDGTNLRYTVRNAGSFTVSYIVSWVPSINFWYHVSLVQTGSVLKFFVNGVQVGSNGTAATVPDFTGTLNIGNDTTGNGFEKFKGYLDEFRVSKGVARWTNTFRPPTSAYSDDSFTKLLLHFDENFTDSEATPKTVTNNSSVVFGASKFGYAAKFTGANYLSLADSADWDFGTGDFTIECWVYIAALPGTRYGLWSQADNVGSGNTIASNIHADGSVQWIVTSTASGISLNIYTALGVITTNSWHHISYVRRGTNFSMRVNGVLTSSQDNPSTSSLAVANSTGTWMVGRAIGGGNDFYMTGYIDEFRVSKGIARWTTDFTPPTVAYTPKDSSLFEKLITTVGNATIKSLKTVTNNAITFSETNKFGGYAALFNGTSSYLSLPNSSDFLFGNENFTIDCWVRLNSSVSEDTVFASSLNTPYEYGYLLNFAPSGLGFIYSTSGTDWTSTTRFTFVPTTGVWYHIAIVRNGANLNLYVDGVQDATTVNMGTDTIFNTTKVFFIGAYSSIGDGEFDGYMDEFRVSKGVARWVTNFTPATYEYTNDSFTKLLLHFNNDVVDSNYFSKFGNRSFNFDGTNDYLAVADNVDFDFGTSDFTFDAWVNFNVIPSVAGKNGQICSQINGSDAFIFVLQNNGLLRYRNENSGGAKADYTVSWTPTVGQWYHLEASRNGTTFRIFIDGVSQTLTVNQAIGTNTMVHPSAVFAVGGRSDGTDHTMNGFIDELRISKGIARHTANFTPMTKPYKFDRNIACVC